MTDEDFEKRWQQDREQVLAHDEEYQRIVNGYKQGSAVNWIIIIGCAVGGSTLTDYLPIESTLLRWILSIAAGVLAIGIGLWIRSLFISTKTANEVEQEVKERYRKTLHE